MMDNIYFLTLVGMAIGGLASIVPVVIAFWSRTGGTSNAKKDLAPSLRSSAQRMIEKKINDDLNVMMGALGKEVKRCGGTIHDLTAELQTMQTAIQDVRSALHTPDESPSEQSLKTLRRLVRAGASDEDPTRDEFDALQADLSNAEEQLSRIATRVETIENDVEILASNVVDETLSTLNDT